MLFSWPMFAVYCNGQLYQNARAQPCDNFKRGCFVKEVQSLPDYPLPFVFFDHQKLFNWMHSSSQIPLFDLNCNFELNV